jgi:hypothetical protein
LGNPSFKLLLAAIREEEDVNPAIRRIAERNPIAESVGRLNLEGMESAVVGEFLKLTRRLRDSVKLTPCSEAGFDRHEDFERFLGEFEALFPSD